MSELNLSRHIPAPPERVWQAWTDPGLLRQWFAPRPVEVTILALDPRPGGAFATLMRLPDGSEVGGEPGCFLEVVPHRRLVFTDALGPDFRPTGGGFMTAIVTLTPDGDGTRYEVRVLHANDADRDRHEEMGFHTGWEAAAEQLAALLAR